MSESTIDKHLRVKSMPSLCFNNDDFVSNEFSVDKFVSECRKYASLDTMRDDLNIFHKILCSAMIELLNKDYADFVNLSSNLAGLDKSIKSVTLPLQSLKNEIEQTKGNLDSTLLSITDMFSERASVHCSKVLIHHLLIINEGLEKIPHLLHAVEENYNIENIEILERIAIVFKNIQFHMHKISDCKNYSLKEEVVSNVARNLEHQLQAVFLQSLSNDIHKQDLHKILLIYSYISEEDKVESIFRVSVVRPFMKNLITQSNITKLGLEKILKDILNVFIPDFCNDVLKLTRRANKDDSNIVPGYDFLVNAVWPEIIDSFEYVAPVYLYSLGDPQQFHQNYCLFIAFLDEFEHICGFQSSVSKLRQQTSYKEFIQKFNLDVYFQIRFQEIAGTFEHNFCLCESLSKEINGETDLPFSLKATVSLWSCINLCWCDSIFLPFLKKDFFRLTVQLIFRYNKHIQYCLKNIKEETLELALLIKDVENLVPKLQTFFLETVEKKLECQSFHVCDTVKDVFSAAVEEMIEFLREIPVYSAKLIVTILVEKCTSHLKLIASIPQRFRKTNREIPSKPSQYVSLVLTPLTEFSVGAKSILPADWYRYCEIQVTDEIMKQCVTLMQDVFTSIKKMEDSLKILKRARDKPTQNAGQFSTGAVTDDDKIRRQLAIDVTYFEDLILKSGLQVSDLKSFKELKDLVTSAEKVSGFSSS